MDNEEQMNGAAPAMEEAADAEAPAEAPAEEAPAMEEEGEDSAE